VVSYVVYTMSPIPKKKKKKLEEFTYL